MNYSLFLNPPSDFAPAAEASGCYCRWENKILFLKRHPGKPYGNTWGIPGGKLEKNETPRDAVIRELHEEVGLDIGGANLESIGQFYCRLPHMDYIFHMFEKCFSLLPPIRLCLHEHLEARWVTESEALSLPLIIGGAEALQYYADKRNEQTGREKPLYDFPKRK